jgi:hypothetical protein
MCVMKLTQNFEQLTEDADAAASESSIVAITFILFARSSLFYFVLRSYLATTTKCYTY